MTPEALKTVFRRSDTSSHVLQPQCNLRPRYLRYRPLASSHVRRGQWVTAIASVRHIIIQLPQLSKADGLTHRRFFWRDRSSFQPWSAWMSASCGRLGLCCSWSIPQFSNNAPAKNLEKAASTSTWCATRRTFVSFLRVTMEAPVNRFRTRTEHPGSVAVVVRDFAARSAWTVSTDRCVPHSGGKIW